MTFPDYCKICGKITSTFSEICHECTRELEEDD